MANESKIQRRRRAALQQLVVEEGTVTAVAELAGSPRTHLSAILAGRRGLGDELAAKLEERTDKPAGWMDDPSRDEEPQASTGRSVESAHTDSSRVPDAWRLTTGGRDSSMDSRKESHGSDAQHSRRAMRVGINALDVVLVPLMTAQDSTDDVVTLPVEDAVSSMAVSKKWLHRHASFTSEDNLALVTGFGDAMSPVYEDGDLLLVDRGVQDVKLDGIYCIWLNDEFFVKRLQRRPGGGLVMCSERPSYESYTLNPARDRLIVLGRVVLVWNARRL